MTEQSTGFDHLDRPGRLAAQAALNTRVVVYTTVAAAVLLSWVSLALLSIGAAQTSLPAEGGPGDWLLRLMPALPLPDWAARFVSLCVTPAGFGAESFLLLWAMWALMSVAMMLPSASPMIRIYCEIADTARAKHEPVVHPLVLVAGYLAVWLAAAAVFAAISLAARNGTGSFTAFAAPAALAVAGLYQFSALKEACLKKCRNPFAILFARWSDKPSRILRLGAEQGVWCLGCCWALMLIMFAVGVMNIFWMALIGLFTIVEKQLQGRLPSRIAGTLLLVWAAALLVASF